MTHSLSPPESSGTWPELSVVQQWFQAVMTHPDGIDAGLNAEDALELAPMTRKDLERMVTRSEKVSARDRISIYGNAYYARLIECLGDSYPVIKRTLGEEAFNGFAFDYLQRYPSQSYTLGHLGEHFPKYLDETRPDHRDTDSADVDAAGWPDFLIDLARLEWTIAQVFDGPGIENKSTLSREQLQNISPHQWPALRLHTVPCLQLLSMRFPLNAFYTAARQTPKEGELPLPAPADSYMAVTRRDYVVRRHDLSYAQYILLNALSYGSTLGDAINQAAAYSELSDETLASELQQWFHQWTSRQYFASVT